MNTQSYEPETYSESARGVIISQARARQEIEAHQAEWDDFVQDPFGYCEYATYAHGSMPSADDTFNARDILTWLGY